MTTEVQQLRGIINKLTVANATLPGQAPKLFEIAVAASAAAAIGAKRRTPPGGTDLYRGGPGHIDGNPQRYTFWANDVLEVHHGVQFTGVSGEHPEADVAIVKSAEADLGRQTGKLPPGGFISIVEVKYRANSTDAVSFADVRGFVGTVIELIEQPRWFCRFGGCVTPWDCSGPLCPCVGPSRLLVSNARIIHTRYRNRHGIAAVESLAARYRGGDAAGMVTEVGAQLVR